MRRAGRRPAGVAIHFLLPSTVFGLVCFVLFSTSIDLTNWRWENNSKRFSCCKLLLKRLLQITVSSCFCCLFDQACARRNANEALSRCLYFKLLLWPDLSSV